MNKSTPAPLVKISRAGFWFVWVLWPLCRGGCNVPRVSNAHPYKASNKIYALFLAIRRNRLCGELRSAGAAYGVDVGGELSASAVHLAELGENLLCAGVVVLGDESLAACACTAGLSMGRFCSAPNPAVNAIS